MRIIARAGITFLATALVAGCSATVSSPPDPSPSPDLPSQPGQPSLPGPSSQPDTPSQPGPVSQTNLSSRPSLSWQPNLGAVVLPELCKGIATCCKALGVTIDEAKCRGLIAPVGLHGELNDVTPEILAAGKAIYNPKKANECVAGIRDFGCGGLDAAPYKATVAACYAAYTGTVAAGGACSASIECLPGNHCDATKKCTALKVKGESCTSSEECSRRSFGNSCTSPDLTCTGTLPDGSPCPAPVCTGPRPDGSPCSASYDCTSGLCDGTCVRRLDNIYNATGCKDFL